MVYCVGLPKSGTQSIASLFENYNAKHEPRYNTLGYLIAKKLTNNLFVRLYFWIYRNVSNSVLESDHQLIYFINTILSTDPHARFIFTYRDFTSWFVSLVNQQYASYKYENGPNGKLLNIERAKLGFGVYDYKESVLNEMLLPGPVNYKKYYDFYFKRVKSVERVRILKLEVNEIEDSLDDIAEFAGVKLGQLNLKGIRSHQRPNKKFELEDIVRKEDMWLFK